MTTDISMNDSSTEQWTTMGSFSKTFTFIPSLGGLILIYAMSIQESGGTW